MDLVTGGTGFVGSHVVRALLARGGAVRCLARIASRRDNLAGLDVEIVPGDLTDRGPLSRAMAGVSAVSHVSAAYDLRAEHPRGPSPSAGRVADTTLAAGTAAGEGGRR